MKKRSKCLEIAHEEGKINNKIHESIIKSTLLGLDYQASSVSFLLYKSMISKIKPRICIYLEKLKKFGNIQYTHEEVKAFDHDDTLDYKFAQKSLRSLIKSLKNRSTCKLLIKGSDQIWWFPNKAMISICAIINRGTQLMTFQKLSISRKQFQRIISSLSNCRKLRFQECKICTENIRFKAKFQRRINCLSMVDCGSKEYSDWAKHPQRVYGLLEGIAKSGLKGNLKVLEITLAKVDAETFKSWATELGLVDSGITFLDLGKGKSYQL
ncbi:unnamed protein product [Moneuplotes crassus]|uniref:Uncharacterized protein n=1 Tax=Euplotes crassus TaxID=5936 RepID=A0AAD1Y4Z2_EUPCR|nr:unnamed protein product [Moneuplotes crassus]